MPTLIAKETLELATPLGAVRVVGPDGPVPFSVVRHDSDERKCNLKLLTCYYEIDVPLKSLAIGQRYVVSVEGAEPARCDSDEYGQLNTVTKDGVTLGISAYNPSENCWQYPKGSAGSVPRDYDILWDEPTEHEFTIVRCPEGGEYDNAMVYVAWQSTANDAEAGDAEDDMFTLML